MHADGYARQRNQLLGLVVAVLEESERATFPAQDVFALVCPWVDAPGAVFQRTQWDSGASEIIGGGLRPDHLALMQHATLTLRHDHPLLVANAAGDLAPATAQEAAGGWKAWQRSPARAFLADLLGWPQMVSVGLRGGGNEVVGLAFARGGRDFTSNDVEFLSTLQPLLQAIDRHVRRMESWHARLASVPVATSSVKDIGLTGREVDVLLMLAEGLTASAAARRLGCSPRTVHKHVGNLYRKLSVRDRLQAVLEAQRRGLLPAPASGRSNWLTRSRRAHPAAGAEVAFAGVGKR